MVDIRPFKALSYSKKAGDLKNLITPPYDKIDKNQQKEYYAKSFYNFCRLILPIEKDKYETARKRIQNWLAEGVLAKDSTPAIFVYRHQFTLAGKTCIRTGFIAALRLYTYDETIVFPHEVTHRAPKADRLKMLRTLQTNLEPVFLIFSDPNNQVANFFEEVKKKAPILEVEDASKVKHTIWRVTNPEKIRFVQKAFEDQVLVITDGHHRYESALAYRDEKRVKGEWRADSAFNYHMSYMVPVEDEGLTVLPTHRLLKKIGLTSDALQQLRDFFTVTEFPPTVEAFEGFLSTQRQSPSFCIYDGTKAYSLMLKDDRTIIDEFVKKTKKTIPIIDVVILRELVFKEIMKAGKLKIDEDIIYVGSTKTALEKVDSGEAKLAFLVSCINPETVWKIALRRELLPEKSTDFYPKPVSGLIMMDIS